MVQALSGTDFSTFVQGNKIAIIDFTATWCGPCQMLKPIIEQLANENQGKAAIAAVDIDQAQDIAREFNIEGVPTVIFFKDGEVAQAMVGVNPKPIYQKVIDQLLA
ncbi:MAG: thioredoxin [Planctomycetota bacterium]